MDDCLSWLALWDGDGDGALAGLDSGGAGGRGLVTSLLVANGEEVSDQPRQNLTGERSSRKKRMKCVGTPETSPDS